MGGSLQKNEKQRLKASLCGIFKFTGANPQASLGFAPENLKTRAMARALLQGHKPNLPVL